MTNEKKKKKKKVGAFPHQKEITRKMNKKRKKLEKISQKKEGK